MKDDLAFIEHILLSIEKIQEYAKNLTAQDFIDNELIQDAVIRNIEISVSRGSSLCLSRTKYLPRKKINPVKNNVHSNQYS